MSDTTSNGILEEDPFNSPFRKEKSAVVLIFMKNPTTRKKTEATTQNRTSTMLLLVQICHCCIQQRTASFNVTFNCSQLVLFPVWEITRVDKKDAGWVRMQWEIPTIRTSTKHTVSASSRHEPSQWQLHSAVWSLFPSRPTAPCRMRLWMSDYSFTQSAWLNIHRSGYSAACLSHCWCHVQLMPPL